MPCRCFCSPRELLLKLLVRLWTWNIHENGWWNDGDATEWWNYAQLEPKAGTERVPSQLELYKRKITQKNVRMVESIDCGLWWRPARSRIKIGRYLAGVSVVWMGVEWAKGICIQAGNSTHSLGFQLCLIFWPARWIDIRRGNLGWAFFHVSNIYYWLVKRGRLLVIGV